LALTDPEAFARQDDGRDPEVRKKEEEREMELKKLEFSDPEAYSRKFQESWNESMKELERGPTLPPELQERWGQ